MRRMRVLVLSLVALFVMVAALFAVSAPSVRGGVNRAQGAGLYWAAQPYDPTLQAGATGDFIGSPVYGPEEGELEHDPDEPFVKIVDAEVLVENFIVEATFTNPYDADDGAWSNGFFFRDNSQGQYRLYFLSDGRWILEYIVGDEFNTLDQGELDDFDSGKDGANTLRLAVDGDAGLFSFNGRLIAELDLSEHGGLGSISIGTGFNTDNEQRNASTGYEFFTIWSIGLVPTMTPTAAAVEAPQPAELGENVGEIEIGGGEVWMFEGEGGATYTIRVLADNPAGTFTTTDERLDNELYDTYLIVMDANGAILAENDDDDTLSDDDETRTNSRVQVTLPNDGTYLIEVRSYADESGGAYTLLIETRSTLNPVQPTPTGEREGRG
jgi:hypothetical protein